MKKLLCCLLSLLLLAACVLPAAAEPAIYARYRRVFIIGIDGAGRFIKDANTPNFDRIFADGAVDYTARAETNTTSAQNWGSILTGVSFLKHGRTNDNTCTEERSSSTTYPTIFTYARKAFPDAQLAAFGNWSNINFGIIENDIDVMKASAPDDAIVTDMICDYFNAGNDPTLFFVQFDSVDHIGHDLGSKDPAYIAQIETVDGYLGRIYDTAAENGLLEDTLFLVTADHGHTISGGHGGITMRETNVTLAAKGKTVVAGGTMDQITRNRDLAAIALYALGLDRPDHMTARLPANLFTGVAGELRPAPKDPLDSFLAALAWIVTVFTALI